MRSSDLRSTKPDPNSGSLTVELVVLAPVLILFTLFALALGRYEIAREQVIGAARAAAEAASVAASAAQAQGAATSAAGPAIQGLGHNCSSFEVGTDTSDFEPDGKISVIVTCQVSFSDLLVPGMPGSTKVTAVQTAPLDPYRSVQ